MYYHVDDTRTEILNPEVGEFILSVNNLIDSLPKDDIYNLSDRLRKTIHALPEYLYQCIQSEKKIDRIKNLVMTHSTIVECKNYLSLVEELRFGKTTELLLSADKINNVLILEYGF